MGTGGAADMSADATHGSRLAPGAPLRALAARLTAARSEPPTLLPHHLRLVVLVLARHTGSESGWPDSNRRLLPPKGSALARLSYTPIEQKATGAPTPSSPALHNR